MTLASKGFLLGLGIGIALALTILELWGSYLDRLDGGCAQPHLLRSFKSSPPDVSLDGYEAYRVPVSLKT